MNDLKHIFSTRLKQAFKNSNKWSQSTAAEHFNVSRNTVNSWAAGNSWPGFDTVDELAKLLNVTTQWLMGADDVSSAKENALNEIQALIENSKKEHSDSVNSILNEIKSGSKRGQQLELCLEMLSKTEELEMPLASIEGFLEAEEEEREEQSAKKA
jgi:transcriptional regulator with XRE-family HTH domain